MDLDPGKVDATMTDPILVPVPCAERSDSMAVHGSQRHDPTTHGPATRAKMSKAQQELLKDLIHGPAYQAKKSKISLAIHADPVLGPASKAKRLSSLEVSSDKRTRTKWRHALRDPLFVAYPEKVGATLREGNNLRHVDRLQEIDKLNKTGTIKQKKCLRNAIFNGRSAILRRFYSKGCAEDRFRYPGDGGPDPQVQTDHESDEGEDPEIEQQEEEYAPKKKHNRPRDLVKRRLATRKWAQKHARINPTRQILITLFSNDFII
jgi:hypothetical protein